MNMDRHARRRQSLRPLAEAVETRVLMSGATLRERIADPAVLALVKAGPSFALGRPNTPVAPFASPLATASFVDPTARVRNGEHAYIGQRSFVAPYATLDAGSGFIKVGSGSAVLDNATITATRPGGLPTTAVILGDNVLVAQSARVVGPAVIGAFGSTSRPAAIGPGALVDGGNVQAGAIVGALARVGPGVTILAGFEVLPGKNVATQAEATTPALGKVIAVPAADLATATSALARDSALARGYATLYQGDSSTGVSSGVPPSVTTIFNGNLATVTGVGRQPATAFEPGNQSPSFLQGTREVQVLDPNFRARATGQVVFRSTRPAIAHHLGRGNSFRGDDGQPITVGSIASTGRGFSVTSPLGNTATGTPSVIVGGNTGTGTSTGTGTNNPGTSAEPNPFPTPTTGGGTGTISQIIPAGGQVVIGQRFTAGDDVVLLGGSGVGASVGDDVTIGSGAVVARSALGNGVVVGARSYVAGTFLPAGFVVAPGSVYVNGVRKGRVEW